MFEKIRDLIVEEVGVDEEQVTMDWKRSSMWRFLLRTWRTSIPWEISFSTSRAIRNK